jgi:TonB family protein
MPTMLNENNLEQPNAPAHNPTPEQKQRQRMVFALALLLIALGVVLFKDRQILSPGQPVDSASVEPPMTLPPPSGTPTAATPQSQPVQAPAVPAHPARSKRTKKRDVPAPAAKVDDTPASSGPVVTATNRTVLPPLNVEVVAGNQHRPVSPGNNSVKVDMQSSATGSGLPGAVAQDTGDTAMNTDAQVSLPPATAERVSRSVKPDYPVLAKQMKVQGAVVLQALIDKGGKIQELHVVTGPSILAAAAQEAVRQWRFKPYYQRGEPVETEARITVNFTISTY